MAPALNRTLCCLFYLAHQVPRQQSCKAPTSLWSGSANSPAAPTDGGHRLLRTLLLHSVNGLIQNSMVSQHGFSQSSLWAALSALQLWLLHPHSSDSGTWKVPRWTPAAELCAGDAASIVASYHSYAACPATERHRQTPAIPGQRCHCAAMQHPGA
jgi:hypothetical protein